MATYKIVYKNHCTPQEQVSSGGRYYLDSDCGRKLTGVASVDATSTSYDDEQAITDSATSLGTTKDVVFIKNTGGGSGNDVLISTNGGTNYYIKLSSGEAFASKVDSASTIKVKCAADEDSTIEYYTGT